MRILWLVTISALLASLAARRIEAGALQIALLASAEVQGDTILLANLLPKTASLRIRAAAEKIALGAAPQNGTTRRLTRESLGVAIAASGLSPSNFAIPREITVRRGNRTISREEICAAIQSSQAKNPLPGFPLLRLQDLDIGPEIRVPPGDAGLEVTQITFDQSIGRARIRVWPRSAPGVLPFYVTAKVSAASYESATVPQRASAGIHSPGSSPVSAPILVSAGRLARLHIHSSSLDMLLEVRPLQRGHLGEVIRVRLPGTGHTLRALVAGDDYLDATL